jgi:hypothetical protein
MLHNKPHQRAWAIALTALLFATLACSVVNDLAPGNPVATVQAGATQAGEVGEAIETLEAVATQIDSGALEATAEAFATEAGLGDVEATAATLATEAFAGFGDVPPDIPVVDAETENFFAMEGVVSYATSMDFDEVVAFYKTGMVEKGWEFLKNGSVEATDAAVLQYDKPDKSAIVTISHDPASGQTYVQVLIQTK